tara:strand:+ start:1016 stop:1903 length:888 start_codon:yes stop_codon:yes gene_type:complete
MFGLEGSGFLIAISVSLLLVGAVVYYFNTRVASLEKALVRQNQVLADFIQNVKASRMEARATHLMEQPGNGATNEAVQAAQQYYSNTVPQEKVDVSDDDEDEASEDGEDDLSDSDDSELDSDDEDDEDDSEENKESMDYPDLSKVKEVNPIVIGNGDEQAFFSMIVDMTTQVPVEKVVEKEGPQVIELLDDNELEEQTDNLTPVEVKAEEDNDEKKVIKLSDVQDLDQVSSSLGSSLEDEDEDDGETIDSKQENVIADFSKLKVAKLKELASKRGIKNATKMKKAELVAALEAKK